MNPPPRTTQISVKQALLKISGRVQGVFYRTHARAEAQKLNLTGYAKNLPDGNVEALLQGQEAQINSFITWAHEGSPSAKVEKVEIEWQEVSIKSTDFKIF